VEYVHSWNLCTYPIYHLLPATLLFLSVQNFPPSIFPFMFFFTPSASNPPRHFEPEYNTGRNDLVSYLGARRRSIIRSSMIPDNGLLYVELHSNLPFLVLSPSLRLVTGALTECNLAISLDPSYYHCSCICSRYIAPGQVQVLYFRA